VHRRLARVEIAIRTTERIKSLVLVNSAGLRVKGVPRADMFVCSENELLKLLFADKGAAEWIASCAPARIERISTTATARPRHRYSWSPRLCNPKLDRWLHRIDVPTHIIWGEEDRVITGLRVRAEGADCRRHRGDAAGLRPHAAHRAAAGFRR
jgi:pimeloyl-ACP methyl ester carboxylesterase